MHFDEDSVNYVSCMCLCLVANPDRSRRLQPFILHEEEITKLRREPYGKKVGRPYTVEVKSLSLVLSFFSEFRINYVL